MNERLAAEEHLRVIRSLMERATVYRAISAPTALVGGFRWPLQRVASQYAETRAHRCGACGNPGAAAIHHCVDAVLAGDSRSCEHVLYLAGRPPRDSPSFLLGTALALSLRRPSLLVAGV